MIITDHFLYITIGLASLSALLLLWIIILEIRLKKVFRGSKAQNLESVFADFGQEIDRLIARAEKVDNIIAHIHHRLTHDISRCHTIRFNPFRDHGSNQSFATCFLNDHGDGVIISSLYSRDKVSVYAKPIIKYRSEYELSAEEKKAMDGARQPKASGQPTTV
ncbi:MAG: DUF4446 family protein [Candidatus Paceibacterota bacterium]